MRKKPNWEAGGWIQTYSGVKFMPLTPRIEDIRIEDIAHALSNVCRYGGHCLSFYSVAQHCCYVSDFLPDFKLEGLLHDATEAYLGDVVRPVKHSPTMRLYRLAEDRLDLLVHELFELDPGARKLVKEYDNRAMFTERHYVLGPPPEPWTSTGPSLPIKRFVAWTPKRAEREFLKRWEKLKRS